MPRKPDYKLSLAEPEASFVRIGAGWANDNGTVSIQLDPYVALPHRPVLKLVLIPNDFNPKTNLDANP